MRSTQEAVAAADESTQPTALQPDLGVSRATLERITDNDLAADVDAWAASLERLAAANPDNDVLQFEVSINLERIGNVWALRGDGFAALGAYLKVLRIREQLVNADSDNSEWRQHLEIILERISRVFVRGTNPGYTDAGREDRQSEAVPPPGIMPNAAHDLNKLAANLGLSFEESAEKLTAAGRGLICGGAD